MKGRVLVGDFGSITSNGTFTVNAPLVGAYSDFCLLALNSSGAPVAVGTEIDTVSLIAGTENLIQPVSPAFLLMRNLYYNTPAGYAAITGIVPMDLTPMGLYDNRESDAYMLGTNGVSSLKCTIKMGTLSGVASVQLWAVHKQGGIYDLMGLGRHVRINIETVTAYGTGEKEFDGYPHINSKGVGLLCVHFANAAGTGTITKAKIEINNERSDLVPVAVLQNEQQQSFRKPQSNYVQCDFSVENYPGSFLPLGRVTRLKSTLNWSVSAAAATQVYIETVHGINEQMGA
jgi:hypothetical protein